jgi:hypothetical protein
LEVTSLTNLNLPLLLLDLPKKEEQVLLYLFLIHNNDNRERRIDLEEFSRILGRDRYEICRDLLNKLVERNIVGRMKYKGILNKDIQENFQESFLNILYDKNNPLESAIQKVGYYIQDRETIYVLNPVVKSWFYRPKDECLRKLKRIKKQLGSNSFIDYLINGLESGKRTNKKTTASKWNTYHAVEMFREKYRAHYGSTYTANKADFAHMKRLFSQLNEGGLPEDQLYIFFDYAFERARGSRNDYILQIFGLKYYANEYFTNVIKNKQGV